MRVCASPLALNFASSRRRTMVSMEPRLPVGAAASGAPLNVTLPVNGCELSQKKPAGRGWSAKLVCAKPATVIHRSTPLWMGSPANRGEPEINAATTAIRATERIKDFILRSFLKAMDRELAPEEAADPHLKKLVLQEGSGGTGDTAAVRVGRRRPGCQLAGLS